MPLVMAEPGLARGIGIRLDCARRWFPLRMRLGALVVTLALAMSFSGCSNDIRPVATYSALGPAVSVAISGDNHYLAVGGIHKHVDRTTGKSGRGTLVLHDLLGKKAAVELYRPLAVHSLAFDPTGTTLWMGCGLAPGRHGSRRADPCPIGEVVQWDLELQKERRTVRLEDTVNAIALSPDGKCLAALTSDIKNPGGYGLQVKIWDAEGMALCTRFALEGCTYDQTAFGPLRPLAFSPNGRILAVASDDASWKSGQVTLWDVERKAIAHVIHMREAPIRWLSFSSSGPQLAIVAGNSVWVADYDKTEMELVPELLPDVTAWAAEWIPRHSVLVCCSLPNKSGEFGVLYDVERRICGTELRASNDGMGSVAVSSNGDVVAIGTVVRRRVYVWRPRLPER